MKKIIILIIFLLFSFTIVNAGWPIPKGCPLEGYEKLDYCPSYYTIWKVKDGIKKTIFSKKEMFRDDLYLDSSYEKYYITNNNYFYKNWYLQKIKENFFVWEWWINMWQIKSWDIVIIDNNIFWYENNENKKVTLRTINYLKNKLNINWNLKIINTYWNYYKVTCENNKISLSNEWKNYDLGFQHNSIVDKNIWNKEKIRDNLQKEIKTCSNFNKLFNITYKDKKDYNLKLDYFKKYIEKKYSKVIKKITWNKKNKILEKIKKIRQEKNNDKNIPETKKENINILLDALIEVLKN